MKLETTIKKVIIALIGNCILGAGVAMISQPCLGADPSVSFSQAYAPYLGLSIGQAITITNIVLLVITFMVKKSNIGIATFIVVFLNQYPVDFVISIIPKTGNMVINIVWILLGISFVAIGCNVIIASRLGMGILDAFVFGIADRVNKTFVFVRYTTDSIFFLCTILLKGYFGIGTILAYLLTGPTIKYTKPLVEGTIKKLVKLD